MGGREEKFDGGRCASSLGCSHFSGTGPGKALEPLALNTCNSRHGASLQTLGAAPPTAARCVFVALLLGVFPQVFIPFILRWS